jgi:response regulator RpfG family c-di-GMP phosphodiesterase
MMTTSTTFETRPHSPNILIVDDERGPRESLRMILSGTYRVSTATDGASALELLRTDEFDLVTVDLNMPGMKGDELMRTIRAEFPQTEIIVITGSSSVESAVEGIRHGVFDYLMKPFDVVRVTTSVERALERRESRTRMVSFVAGLDRVLGPDRDNDRVIDTLDESRLAQQRLRHVLSEPALGLERSARPPSTGAFLEVLAETIESRDLFMRGHARRVAFYADLLSAALCLSREERNHVRIAAFVHDIGKVGAPSDVLAGERLPEPVRIASVEPHAAIGEKLLRPLDLGPPVATTVRHHHERFDGAGYPDGLAGEDIPLAARIVAIADAFDAMTCDRPYRPARTGTEAVEELRREAGRQFDPGLVPLFCELILSGATDAVTEAGTLIDQGLQFEAPYPRHDRGAA